MESKHESIASLMILDVSASFDSQIHPLHNLWKRQLDEKIAIKTTSFLSNRCIRIAIDGFRSTPYQINTNIPQRPPLSPILYLVHNTDFMYTGKKWKYIMPIG